MLKSRNIWAVNCFILGSNLFSVKLSSIIQNNEHITLVVRGRQTLSLNGVVSGTVTVNPSLGHSLPGEFTVGQVHTARLVHSDGQVHAVGQVHTVGRVHSYR